MKKLDQQVGSQDELPRSTRTSVKESQVPRNGKEDEPQVSRSIEDPANKAEDTFDYQVPRSQEDSINCMYL